MDLLVQHPWWQDSLALLPLGRSSLQCVSSNGCLCFFMELQPTRCTLPSCLWRFGSKVALSTTGVLESAALITSSFPSSHIACSQVRLGKHTFCMADGGSLVDRALSLDMPILSSWLLVANTCLYELCAYRSPLARVRARVRAVRPAARLPLSMLLDLLSASPAVIVPHRTAGEM